MTIEQQQQEITEEFADIDDWLDRYAQIIDMGNELPPLDESVKTPRHLIEGCQSRVWLDASLDPEGRVHFRADSDALIVKGIISMLVRVLDGPYTRRNPRRPTSISSTTSASANTSRPRAPTACWPW